MGTTSDRGEFFGRARAAVKPPSDNLSYPQLVSEVKNLQSSVDGINSRISNLSEILEGLNKKLDNLGGNLEGINSAFNKLPEALKGIDEKLNNLLQPPEDPQDEPEPL